MSRDLKGNEWLVPENYLPELAPDLAERYQAYLDLDDDISEIGERLTEVQVFAYRMVRYAISPDLDSAAYDRATGDVLLNSKTGQPITIEDLGVERAACIGPTSGIDGRERMVAEIAVKLYRSLYEHTPLNKL